MGNIDIVDKRILVTGGSGYLGRELIDRLTASKANVLSIDLKEDYNSKEYKSVSIDLNDYQSLEEVVLKFQPQIIFHLAASLNRSRDFSICNTLMDANLKGTINLLNSLKNINYDNLIFTSTSEVYGLSKKTDYDETDEVIAASPYSLSKLNAENAIKTFSKIYTKAFTILRLFNFYGENMPRGFFVSDLVNKLKNNEDFDMTLGEQTRDFLKTESVLEALMLSTQVGAKMKTYNVCSGKGIKIKDLAESLKNQLNSSSKINYGALPYRKNEVWMMVGNNNKIKKELGWIPQGFTV